MKSESIVDNRLCIRHNAIGFLKKNLAFHSNSLAKGHLANQLLLYDKIVIPTKDFGIIPVLIKWMGLNLFNKAIDDDALNFIRIKDFLGYFGGDGDGIITFTGKRGKSKTWSWPQGAMFGEIDVAIELQLKNLCPDIYKKERMLITKNIINKSKISSNINKIYEKNIINETYEDIIRNDKFSKYIFQKNGKDINNDDFTKLKGIQKNQIRILHTDKIRDGIDLLLHIAEINMMIYLSTLVDGADLFVPDGAEILLKNKIIRLGIEKKYLKSFISLLELKNIPDLGKAAQNGELSLLDIYKIRETKNSIKFRNWLKKAIKQEEKDLVKLYIASLENKSLIQSLPLKALRFAVTAIASLLCPALGLTIGVSDSFFTEQWLKGYSPKLFLDELQKIKIESKK